MGDVERGLPRITRQASCRLPGGRSGRRGNGDARLLTSGTLGYPLGLEGPRRAAMRPTWTPNGLRTANYRRMTALEGASGSALSFPSPPAGQPRARELEARVRTLLKRMNSPPRPLPA